MIIGVDLGNYATKTSEGVFFLSKVSKVGNILKNSIELQIDNNSYYIEEEVNLTQNTERYKSKI
ncbi:MAG: hypothetical protein KatS3mg079_696 [Caloramator sp.]|nr:MAG: hypothetical protein KatS3mg079_696 [Caloramator sp.]